ncbi:hypothetical protein [Helicobacter mesocricetorum]|uniref:hypothetical protein n=1 Tax=Helicobacter mesocricetorum TaxID=87012 RepID=UPI000CF144C3|nr:hypothetical protein [Helicobacter mesocricetorum]
MRIISVLLVGILFLSIYLFLGQRFAWNFIFAFISFCGIVFAVFFTQKKKISQLMANATQEELESLAMFYQEKDVKEDEIWREEGDFSLKQERGKSEYKAFWKNFDKNSNRVGIKMFFMPFRLLAYAFLVLGFFILLKQDYLDILGFFSGLVVANIMIVGFYFLKM